MGDSLQKRIDTLIKQVLAAGPGAWLVWCDPRRDWLPLLERVAGDGRLGGFTLLKLDEWTAGAFGGPLARKRLQEQIDQGESFVLHIPIETMALGWLWAQALLAEQIYDRSLRAQLLDWGWRPHALTIGDEEIASLARLNLQKDPAEWGGDGLEPDLDLLLNVLAGYDEPDDDNRLLLDITVDAAGLPPVAQPDLALWRSKALARLLVTQAQQAAPDKIAADHELLVAAEQRPFALRLLERWMDSHHLAQTLPDAILQADRIAPLGSLLTTVTADEPPFVSNAAERVVFVNTCTRLAESTGRALLDSLTGLGAALERHAQSLWGHRLAGHVQAIPWGELQRLSQAACELVTASPSASWPTPQAAIDWYVGDGWRMDHAGEEIARSLNVSPPELVRLIAPLRAAYRARWEDSLIRWSDLWSGAGSPIPASLGSAGAWLKTALASASSPTAILVLDALRYDLGCTLAARINQQEGVERAAVVPARAPLPSITALGMGMALPIDEEKLRAEIIDGTWQLSMAGQADNLSLAGKRRSWWIANVDGAQIVQMSDVLVDNIPEHGPICRRLVVYDAIIDIMGHDDQLEVQGSESALSRYLDAVEHLRNRGWLRILVVTDHGYIHWPVNEEKNTDHPAPAPAYVSRRALGYAPNVPLPHPQALAPGGQWRVALPRGAASFRAYGGLGYFHGGASLQEWIIPCIAIEWPQQARPVVVTLEPLDRVMSLRPTVRLNVTAASLLRVDSISRQVEVVVRSQQTQTILFRGQPILATIDRPQVEVTLQQVAGAAAARRTPVRVELRDPNTEERLDATETTLMIELTDW